jgi:predicted transcriptional regulator
MAQMDASEEVVDVVTRRSAVLAHLDGTTADRAALVEQLDVSRSTVNRSLRELESLGFVTRTDGEFTASTTGRVVADLYREFLTVLSTTVDAEPLLSAVPPTAAVSPAMLRGGEVRLAEPPTPYEPIERVTELVTGAETYRTLSPAVTRLDSVDRIADAIIDGSLDAEVVFEASAAEQVRTARPDAVRKAMASDQFAMYATADLPYGLSIVRTSETSHAVLVVYGPESEFRGVVINDSAAAVDWAEDVYRRHRAAATELPPPEEGDDGHYT